MPSATYSRWDVVAVHFPFVERTGAKRRPAVIVSGDGLARGHGLYWLVMVTTAKAGLKPDDIPISNREVAGLPEQCVVRPSRLATLGGAQLSHRLGSLGRKDRAAVSGYLLRQLS
jgi:mRNA interferase MazF